MLDSLVTQTVLPQRVIVVNDNSSDNTQKIVEGIAKNNPWLMLLNHTSSDEHIPGSKVVNAFYSGLEALDNNYDIICKFDADIILPNNYLESIIEVFKSDKSIGIAGGLAYIERNGSWIYETVASKDHVRGPFKAYRKACFEDIGGLRHSIGWDTVDTLLAIYHGWKVQTDKSLHIKHLKPTGKTYTPKSKYLQGEALYKMHYGLVLTVLTALKSAINKRSISYFFNTISGYFKAKTIDLKRIVTEDEGKHIRQFRWKGIKKYIGL